MPPASLADWSANRRGAAVAPKIETAIATNTLRFRCPNTGRVVDSGISTQYRTRLISIPARCPMCENLHEWLVVGESLGVVSSADHHAEGGRLVEAQSERQDFDGQSAEIIELREQLLHELNHRFKNTLITVWARSGPASSPLLGRSGHGPVGKSGSLGRK
jgi:hypothetical protein